MPPRGTVQYRFSQKFERAQDLRRQGYSYTQIARRLDMSRSTIASWGRKGMLPSRESRRSPENTDEFILRMLEAEIRRGRPFPSVTAWAVEARVALPVAQDLIREGHLTLRPPPQIDPGTLNVCQTPREREMVTLRLEGKTLQEIADAMGITRQRVEQILSKREYQWLRRQAGLD